MSSFYRCPVTRETTLIFQFNASVKLIQQNMLHSTGYRLTFHPAHIFCPLCTPPGNPRVPLQPCCFYPGEMCPESHVERPMNSVMALRSPSYSFAAPDPLNAMPFSFSHRFQSSTLDVTRAQAGEDLNSNNGRLNINVKN